MRTFHYNECIDTCKTSVLYVMLRRILNAQIPKIYFLYRLQFANGQVDLKHKLTALPLI